MTKDPNQVTYEKTDVADKELGKNLFHAPQPALPALAVGSLSTGGINSMLTGDAALLNNTISRLNAMEAALIKLGLLRHP